MTPFFKAYSTAFEEDKDPPPGGVSIIYQVRKSLNDNVRRHMCRSSKNSGKPVPLPSTPPNSAAVWTLSTCQFVNAEPQVESKQYSVSIEDAAKSERYLNCLSLDLICSTLFRTGSGNTYNLIMFKYTICSTSERAITWSLNEQWHNSLMCNYTLGVLHISLMGQ